MSVEASYPSCHALLRQRLAEKAPGRIQLLTGPRQVGKTTLLLELAEELGEVAVYAAADGPQASVPGFWQRLWSQTEDRARSRGRAVLLLDEAQLLADWAARLKGEWDRLRRRKLAVHVVVTGSSALRIGSGSRESLAGRFERITLTHWTASALVETFGLGQGEAVNLVVSNGAYPGAIELRHDPARWETYVRDSIVAPAIGRDLLALGSIRRPALLRQIFAVACSSPASIVSLQKIQGQLQDRGALETIAHYLELLEEAFLVAWVRKFARGEARQRAAPPKLVTLSNAFLAVTDPRGIPDPRGDAARFGAWVENACLARAWNAGQNLRYWRQEPYEVDAILEGSWGAIALEVKTGDFSAADLRGLAEFTRREPEFRPLVVCDPSTTMAAKRLGFEAMSWQEFLLKGPNDA